MSRNNSGNMPFGEGKGDPISFVIGTYGWWQLKTVLLLSLCGYFSMFHFYSPMFINAPHDHWCSPPDHLKDVHLKEWRKFSQPNGSCIVRYLNWKNYTPLTISEELLQPQCTNFTKCTKWDWDRSKLTETVASEWILVCDQKKWDILARLAFLIGAIFGAPVSGFLSDRLGRKPILMCMILIQVTMALSLTFSPNLGVYLMGRIILGFFCMSAMVCAFTLSVEIMDGNWIVIVAVSYFLPMPFACIFQTVVSIYVLHWRYHQLTIAISGLLILILWWCISESPRWLLNSGDLQYLEEVLRKASSFNRRLLPNNFDQIASQMKEYKLEKPNILDLFKSEFRSRTLSLFIISFCTMSVYYGLVLNLVLLEENLIITSIVLGITEILAILITIPLMIKVGRRHPAAFSYFMSGSICVIIFIIIKTSNDYWSKIICILLAKLFISICFASFPLHAAELYPTLLRNYGIGFAQSSGLLASMILPFVFESAPHVAVLVLGGFGVIAGICTLFLAETKNVSLINI